MAVQRGMLLLDPDFSGKPIVWAAVAPETLIAHVGTMEIKVTLKKAELPAGWHIIHPEALASDLIANDREELLGTPPPVRGSSGLSIFDINAVNLLWDALLDAWHETEPPKIEKAEEVLRALVTYLGEAT